MTNVMDHRQGVGQPLGEMKARSLSPLRVLQTPAAAAKPTDRASVEIYKPFFLAGIFCVLTVGCLLGAIALYGIGRSGSFTSPAWSPYILAHANSQLFGWVGFFVMGFALQQHAPSVGRVVLFHRLAWASLLLMAGGIALRFVAEPMLTFAREVWVPIGVFACSLQAVAVTIFIFNMFYCRHRSGGPMPWQVRYVFASLTLLFLVSIAEPFVFFFSHQAERLDSIQFIARWYPVLRETQFLGFVAMMIFGISMVKLNSCFGAGEAHEKLGKAAFCFWLLGLGMRVFGWLYAFEQGFAAGSQTMFFAGGIVLAVTSVALIFAARILEPFKETFRSHKFVRGAFTWLVLAGILLMLEPLHLTLIGAPFSHAYTGAIRHAVTVGFISQMILGFGAHVIARMNDLDETRLPSLWSVFILLNLGNTARVVLEIATDYTDHAFVPMGVTGFIELVALAIWAVHVTRPMLVRMQTAHAE